MVAISTNKYKSILLSGVFLLLSVFNQASPIKILSTRSGLSSGLLINCAKDARGYIWICTGSGIDRYDGEDIRHFKLKQNTYTFAPAGLYVTTGAKAYAYSGNKVFSPDESETSFQQLKEIALPEEAKITCILAAKNSLYLGTRSGLYAFERGKTRLIGSTSGKNISSLVIDDTGYLWIGTSQGIYVAAPGKRDHIKALKREIRVSCLFYDSITKTVALSCDKNRLLVYEASRRRCIYTAQLPVSDIIQITAVSGTKLWICSKSGVVSELNRLNYLPENDLLNATAINESEKTKGPRFIMADGPHLWACAERGLALFSLTHTAEIVFSDLSDIQSIIQDAKGDYWIAAKQGLRIYKRNTGKYASILQGSARISSLFRDAKNNIIAGSANGELMILDQDGHLADRIRLNERQPVRCIFQDSERAYWFATTQNLYRYSVERKLSSFPVSYANQIRAQGLQDLQIATDRGLYHLNRYTEKINRLNLAFLSNDRKIPSELAINAIAEDPDNRNVLWIATQQYGLLKYNTGRQRILSYENDEALPTKTIYALAADEQGRLWFSSPRGISCFRPGKTEAGFVESLTSHGPSARFLYKVAKDADGKLIWAGAQGSFLIDPAVFVTDECEQLNLHFGALDVFCDKVRGYTPPSKNFHLDEATTVTLGHNERSFRINFINLYPGNSAISRYSWMLEGYDDAWSAPGQNHRAVYANLSPGQYIFKVKVSLADNPDLTMIRSLKITIDPPIWQSPIAYAFYIVAVTGLFVLLLQRHKRRLESIDASQKVRFLINIANDLATPISLISAPLQQLERENLSDEGRQSIELASVNCKRLANMVAHMLDYQKIDKESDALRAEHTDVYPLLCASLNSCQIKAKTKFIDIKIISEDLRLSAWIDKRKLEFIIEAVLNDLLNYVPEHSKLELYAERNNAELAITFRSDNLSLPPYYRQIFNSRSHRQIDSMDDGKLLGAILALMMSKKLIILHNGRAQVLDAPEAGIRITIPLCNDDRLPQNLAPDKHQNIEKDVMSGDSGLHRLLIVEQNDALRDFLSEYFQKKYQVSVCDSAEQALIELKQNLPYLIISSVLLPEQDGVTLCRLVKSRANTCHIPFIMLTALSEKDDIIRGFDAGADDYIIKPFDIGVLEIKIAAHLRNRALYKRKLIDDIRSTESTLTSEQDYAFLQNVTTYIQEHIADEHLSIDALASAMAMSRSAFYKRIKLLTSQNPMDLVREVRMRKAAQLLVTRQHTIAEIAYLTGHGNSKYFSTAFKRYYGMSPSSFVEHDHKADSN